MTKTSGERLVQLETKMDIVSDDVKEIKNSVKLIADALPLKADKNEVDQRFKDITKTTKLQNILTNMLISVFSVIMTSTIMFWLTNK